MTVKLSADTLATNLVAKYNQAANDDKRAFHTPTGAKLFTIRTVLKGAEAKSILADIKKLDPKVAKRVLTVLSARVGNNQLHLDAASAATFSAFAKTVGLSRTFVGQELPPMIMG